MMKARTISEWYFIEHGKEEDELKDHIHLLVFPNKLLDTMDLSDALQERDPARPLDKPLGVIPWRLSSVDDWILYCEHFEMYLNTKGETRQLHYTEDDFTVCDEDSFHELYHHAHTSSTWAEKNRRLQLLNRRDFDPFTLLTEGQLPLTMASQIMAFNKLKSEHYGHTYRNGRQGHEEEEEE